MSTLTMPGVALAAWRCAVPGAFIVALFGLSLSTRVAGIPALQASVQGAALLLALWYALLMLRAWRSRRLPEVNLHLVRTHWVQAAVQGSIFLYWATAWPFIAGQFPLIAAQACFAYACTMLLGWTRRGQAELGFGPLPIILSTNLFLCFRDEWFYLQFLMIGVGILGKEFLRWQRDGRSTHIFNPSVLGLSLFSLALLLSGRTDISWAQQIAVELGRPDHIYLWIFGVGLIVQFMFQVTLVTWAAAATLWLLGMAYTQWTGIHWFLDAGIPVAVFLGLHLLVTDPATSPRSNGGRTLFGVAYGTGVFLLYGLLELLGAPRFYDKLLMVPLLNLAVPWIDRWSHGTALARIWPFARLGAMSGQRQNLIYMALWIASFGAMYASHAVGPGHPGRAAGFWQTACEDGRRNACRNLLQIAEHECVAGQLQACRLLAGGAGVAGAGTRTRILAAAQACDLGDGRACGQFARMLADDGAAAAMQGDCAAGDARACYALGTAFLIGHGVPADRAAAALRFDAACTLRWAPGCSNLAEMTRYGVGVDRDTARAQQLYERACAFGYGSACLRLASWLEEGSEIAPAATRAAELRARSCRLGTPGACAARPPG